MMGDNRDNSTDSRFPQVGYVPFENIIGRAQIIFFSVDRRRARLGGLALAVVGALEPVVHDRAMRRARRNEQRSDIDAAGAGAPSLQPLPDDSHAAAGTSRAASRRRVRRARSKRPSATASRTPSCSTAR